MSRNIQKEEKIIHPFPPIFDAESRILILGSFPSVKSREQKFYYGHPRNRFWSVTSAVFSEEVPGTVDEKKQFLRRNHIAVWDVIHSCRITGSSDASIRDVKVNDITPLLCQSQIGSRIYTNGAAAWNLYRKYIRTDPDIPDAVKLPSTSPANAAWSLERLIEAWKIIRSPV
ncbi:MAG: DNA-deoxyinosine glycosylase [Eubacteriales bacterium]|nr:DNA-deoxyinosine glycosylase [Eubacteriales bacterium]